MFIGITCYINITTVFAIHKIGRERERENGEEEDEDEDEHEQNLT